MAPPLLTLKGITLGFGGDPLFEGTELTIGRGDKVCLVGRNGSGKSTLLKVIAGLVEPDGGERMVQSGVSVAYLPQEPDLTEYDTVTDYVAGGLHAGEEDALHKVEMILEDLRVPGDLSTANLSGGESRRAAIARSLVGDPDIILLDEPTNHLDLPSIQWLEETLRARQGSFVLISHDRRLLEKVTDATFWLDRGVVKRLDKGFEAFDAWSEEVLELEALERHKLNRLILKETQWSREGISARRTRNQGRLRRLYDLRAQRAKQIDPTGRVRMDLDTGEVSGKLVLEAEDVSFAWGDRPIVKGYSTKIRRGDKIGVIGPNGAGKSTLLGLLTGALAPQSGSIRTGIGLTPVHLDQKRTKLDPDKTIWETLCDMGGDLIDVRGKSRHVVSYMRDFLFQEIQARSPVGSLSGGERNRLLLAKTLALPSNFLILDEPTNDLDMDTLDLLQEMLSDYDGTLLLVSHDRDFLDRIVTSTIVLEGDGVVREYPGGYADYERQRAGESFDEPVPAKTAAPSKPKEAKPKEAKTRGPKVQTKLTFKQERLAKELPGTMEKLEAEISTLEAKLAGPDFFTKDPDGFHETTERLGAAQAELAEAEDQWLEIEMLREEFAAARGS